ncbi:unnamed protein product, partial [Brassica rapa subsp. trilocularis]
CAFELNILWVLWLELLLRSAESCLKGSAQTRITPNNSDCLQACLDGRLVPATDEEILEVNESDMYTASDASQTIGYLPAQGLPPRLSHPH